MISFRYHVVSLVAVLLALAVGVALGGGPLSEIGRGAGDAATERAESRFAELEGRLDLAESTAAFQDDVAGSLGQRAIGSALSGRPVSILAMPGVEEPLLSSLGDLIGQAGGSVAGTYAVQPGMVAPDGKSLVDTMSTQVLENVEGTEIPAEATTYDRMGQLVGRAVATEEEGGTRSDGPAGDILSSLRGAELLTTSTGGQVRGSLVLLVLGDEPADPEGVENIVGGLATGIGAQSDGIVVAGTTASAAEGVLGLLRDQVSFTANVSSVDSVQTVTGRVATVLALGAAGAGDPGHFGALGIDGAVPRG